MIFDQLLQSHKENHGSAALCVREYDFQVLYGVVSANGHYTIGYKGETGTSIFR